INENLFESVIFGHRRGSFTGALDDRLGLIDEADEGTLFFDEIAEVPVSFQAKLLRFIESKKYRVLGNPTELTANVRILAATNRDLKQLIREKLFRDDFFYRLNVLSLTLPPLRARKSDIRAIVAENKHFLKGKEMGDDFWGTMLNYDWPGNFRELFAVLKRAGILCNSPITGKDIESIFDKDDNCLDEDTDNDQVETILAALENGASFWDVVKEPFMDRELNRGEVKAIINWGLEKADGRFVDALAFYNIDRSEYKRFMKFIHNNKIKVGR
ncbi:MAG: sigma-54-dependent Fis family transcriptional regulator, partial [bacterium]|nr:sigma-54-dependent Fis family transcriptional regulator [bacterium]